MNNTIKSTLALGFVVAAAVLTSTAEAEIHSRSKELVVMEARDLPEQAQARGNSLFLHSDNAGSTYLYVEQQHGARLSVFDVTDPAHPALMTTIAPQLTNTHKNWWECDTGIAYLVANDSSLASPRPDLAPGWHQSGSNH